MARLVLSDASPLIGLARVDGFDWLHQLFGTVEVTPAVAGELTAVLSVEPVIVAGLESEWLKVRLVEASGPGRPSHLGHGEWSTILAALDYQGSVLVLMDDRLGRREAKGLGITVAGTAAVIAMAARRRLIPSARSVFEQLLASDFIQKHGEKNRQRRNYQETQKSQSQGVAYHIPDVRGG